jgi:DNA-binding transcriptional ArsR family regulator
MNELQPTLWRTCRILANARRLSCLVTVFTHPGSTVKEIAKRTGLPPDQASLGLRALQARGLIHATRSSRWVYYHPLPDSSVAVATPILTAMRRALIDNRLSSAAIAATLTAFTHPRRLVILRHLYLDVRQTACNLSRETNVSPQALWRHLDKLRRRGVVVMTPDGFWQLADSLTPLSKAMLTLVVRSNA